jgi:hypothetical protein
MVVESIPFVFPHVGRMTVHEGEGGLLNVSFMYENGYGAMVGRGFGERMFRLTVIDANGAVRYTPEILGEGVDVAFFLTEDEVTALLTRVALLPNRV